MCPNVFILLTTPRTSFFRHFPVFSPGSRGDLGVSFGWESHPRFNLGWTLQLSIVGHS